MPKSKLLSSLYLNWTNPEAFQSIKTLGRPPYVMLIELTFPCCLHELWLMKDMIWMIQVITLHKWWCRQATALLDSGTTTSTLLGYGCPHHSIHLLNTDIIHHGGQQWQLQTLTNALLDTTFSALQIKLRIKSSMRTQI